MGFLKEIHLTVCLTSSVPFDCQEGYKKPHETPSRILSGTDIGSEVRTTAVRCCVKRIPCLKVLEDSSVKMDKNSVLKNVENSSSDCKTDELDYPSSLQR
jgi:hypothetical protein